MARKNEQELADGVKELLPENGDAILYSDFLVSMEDQGLSAASTLLHRMKRAGELRYELRENPENPVKRDLYISRQAVG